ncbi:MAG: METTL5 family protein [Methanobrevibacter sp.]|jgi:putative methylase|nr:METTL5 family protein [Candidatus Methanovirga basalitermitum]
MLKVQNKKDLEIRIEAIPKHPNPKIKLEQYSTPATIAADLLWNAYTLGDIDNKNILDLGSGTGIFTIGSALLNAKCSVGIDVDQQSVDLAIKTANSMEIDSCIFLNRDINLFYKMSSNELNKSINQDILDFVDVIIQNPPFGSQYKGKKGSDRIFIQVSMNLSPVIYSFHISKTENFLDSYFKSLGGRITHKFSYDFPIPKLYDFHTKNSKNIQVIVLRVENEKFL